MRKGRLVKRTFEQMLEDLNRQEYNDIFDCLQINQDGDMILIRYGLAEMQAGMWNDLMTLNNCDSTAK